MESRTVHRRVFGRAASAQAYREGGGVVLLQVRLCLRRIINYPNNSNIIVVVVTESRTVHRRIFRRAASAETHWEGGGVVLLQVRLCLA